MDGSTVNDVVDKLAEKIGVAAEKLAPIAEETVEQVSRRGLAYVVMAGLLICVAMPISAYLMFCFAKWAGRKGKVKAAYHDNTPYYWPAGLLGVSAIIYLGVGIKVLCGGLSQWLAPIPYLLGK